MDHDQLLREIDREPTLREYRALLLDAIRPALSIRFDGAHSSRSRFGGPPDLPPGTAFPRHRFGPYRFLGQFDLSELAPHTATMPPPWRSALPAAGLLSFFVGDDPTGEIDPSGEMFWGDPSYALAHYAQPGTELVSIAPPIEVDFGRAVGVTFASGWKLPFDSYQAPPSWPSAARSDALFDALDAVRGERWSDHVFGYPAHTSLAYDPTPTSMLPLLTLRSNEERAWTWHDGDCLMLFVAPGTIIRGWIALGSDAG